MNSPYFTAEEAVAHWRFPSVDALRMWARRHNFPVKKRGRNLLFDKQLLEQAMRPVRRERAKGRVA